MGNFIKNKKFRLKLSNEIQEKNIEMFKFLIKDLKIIIRNYIGRYFIENNYYGWTISCQYNNIKYVDYSQYTYKRVNTVSINLHKNLNKKTINDIICYHLIHPKINGLSYIYDENTQFYLYDLL
jgi:hypothetical protein